uniref:Palmitoyltransferase n=1 Tax=Sparus aurata TaxID=8175 RepID=A0A671TNC7_SPAAU
MASLRCRRDPCGVICLILTYFSVFYADYVVIQYVLIPAYTDSVWCTLHGSVFNLILLLLLACHSKAVFSDPGMVPLPDTAIDFSDLRSQSSRMNERGCEGWTVCSRCETYRPPRAHHCRVCQRCIRRMDHHCPWINNCVGELNQKYFIQFLFYTGEQHRHVTHSVPHPEFIFLFRATQVKAGVVVALCVCRYGQPVLAGAGGVGLGVEDQERERRRSRERRRGVAQQASDRVSPEKTIRLCSSVSLTDCELLNCQPDLLSVLTTSSSWWSRCCLACSSWSSSTIRYTHTHTHTHTCCNDLRCADLQFVPTVWLCQQLMNLCSDVFKHSLTGCGLERNSSVGLKGTVHPKIKTSSKNPKLKIEKNSCKMAQNRSQRSQTD